MCFSILGCAGEPDHGEGTDDEEVAVKTAPSSSSSSGVELRKAPQSVSMEVLVRGLLVRLSRYDSLSLSLSPQQEMARWNKMVAYLNLGLFFLLLLLIVTVVLCMNYYWLVYQMPASGGGMDMGSSRFTSGPMA